MYPLAPQTALILGMALILNSRMLSGSKNQANAAPHRYPKWFTATLSILGTAFVILGGVLSYLQLRST